MSLDTFAQSLADRLDQQLILAQVAEAQTDTEQAAAESRLRQVSGWLYDPVGWITTCVEFDEGQGLTAYQDEIIAAVPTRKRVSARGPHGLGKTAMAALLVWWFSLTRDAAGIDWKAATTAGAWRQLEKYLWPEIKKWSKRIRWDVVGRPPLREGRELLDLSIKLDFGQAFAVASDDPALLEGVHGDHVLYVFDESKAIIDAVFDAAEGAFSGAGAQPGLEAYAVAFSTPGEPSGRFFEIHQRRPGLEDWWARHVTLDEAITARRISQAWADQRARLWGIDSALYANRVLGEFHSADEDGVIPLAWIEAAVERWRAWDENGRPEPIGRRVVGVDVARGGADKTVLAVRQGHVVQELRVYAKQDTMETAGRVAGTLAVPQSVSVVDTDGLGAGVTDRLREQGKPVVAFHAGTKTDRRDASGELKFTNWRSAAWWNLREMLDPHSGEHLALPDDPELIGDLTAPKWRVLSGGKIQVEKREDIIARLGRSPDRGTAVVQAFWISGRPTAGNDDGWLSYAAADELGDVEGYAAY